MASRKDKPLCKWKSKDIEKDFKTFRSLVKGARYACQKCGRVAKSKKNLCRPVALD